MWRDLTSYLDRFKNLKTPKEFKCTAIQKVVQEFTGITLEPTKIKIQGTTLFLSISPLYKSEIILHQEEIKEALKKERVIILRIT